MEACYCHTLHKKVCHTVIVCHKYGALNIRVLSSSIKCILWSDCFSMYVVFNVMCLKSHARKGLAYSAKWSLSFCIVLVKILFCQNILWQLVSSFVRIVIQAYTLQFQLDWLYYVTINFFQEIWSQEVATTQVRMHMSIMGFCSTVYTVLTAMWNLTILVKALKNCR